MIAYLLAAATAACVGLATTVPAHGPWATSPQAGQRQVAGDLRLHEFRSRVFGNTRMLRVLVPDGYDAPENAARPYPVLYLNDGQNLFDAALPFVETRYRILGDAPNRGLGGSSAGALAAIYTVVMRPGVFGRLLIESPSIYVDDARILRDAADIPSWPQRIHLGAGTNESGRQDCDPSAQAEPELVRDVRRFERLLGRAGVDPARIHLVIVPCAVHDEAAWAARLPDALTFLFAP